MEKSPRPPAVTVICVLSYIGVVIGFPSVFSPSVKKMGDFFPALFGTLIAANFISTVGVWYMKKWGVHLFVAASLIDQAMKVGVDTWTPFSVALPALFTVISLIYYRNMDSNL